MNRKRAICVSVSGFLVVLLLILAWPKISTSQPSKVEPTPPAHPSASMQSPPDPGQASLPQSKGEAERIRQEKRQKVETQIEGMLNTAIAFYGKVVDQNGDSVPNARVGYGLVDKFAASGGKGETVADTRGFFTISGVRGAVISVSVYKDGYYAIQNVSNQSFAYGYGSDTDTKPPPSKDSPAIFVLQKMGQAEPLIELSSRQLEVPRTGQPVTIDLATGRPSQSGLQVSSQIGEKTQGRFDWRYELNVPGGGLVERAGQFEFEAPQDGYKDKTEVGMLASKPDWKNADEKSYFVKLPDGRFARIQVRFYPRDYRSMIVIESYLNPTPGSRNLEYDPAKRIEP